MKLTVELPVQIFEGLMQWALKEYRPTPQHAAYLLAQCVRERQQAGHEVPMPALVTEDEDQDQTQ